MIRFRQILAVAVMLLLPLTSGAEETDSLRMLWIGNSYTFFNDLPSIVRDIAASQGMKLSMTTVLKGGEHLSGHLRNPRLHELLKHGGWDYVIIQEFSAGPAADTRTVARTVYPYARTIDSLAVKCSPDAKVMFYMTWGHKYGNRKPVAEYPLSNGYEGMQERLKTSYLEMAYDNGAWCAPVGMAWRAVRSERPDCILYRPDCYHPAVPGSYLAANVIFTTILQRPYQTAFTAELPAEQAEYLQRTAQRTVLDNLVLLNIR